MDRLKSRKFWIAVLTAALFVLHNDINQAAAVVIAYLGANTVESFAK